MHLLVLANEVLKGLLHVWRYRVNFFAQLAMFGFLFAGVGFLMGRGRMDAAALPSMLVGFVVWYYAFMAILSMSTSLATEAQTGTLEQAYISPAPPACGFSRSCQLTARMFMTLCQRGRQHITADRSRGRCRRARR